MVLISAEPVIFLYVYCYSFMYLLGQKFILDRLCLQHNVDCSSTPQSDTTTFAWAGSNTHLIQNATFSPHDGTWDDALEYQKMGEQYSYISHDYGFGDDDGMSDTPELDVRSQAVQLYMLVTAANAVTSIVSSQVLGYWMDRMSRKVLMTGPVAGGLLWAMVYVLVAYFDSSPIQYIFIGVFFGGITGGYVTLKTAVTSYIIQETPQEMRTVRLSIVEAAIFLAASASLFSMNLATTYLTKNYSYLFMGVEGGFIITFIYIFFILRDDVEIEYPHLRYSYDDLDGSPPVPRRQTNQSYGSMDTTPSLHRQHRQVADIIVPQADGDDENDYDSDRGSTRKMSPAIEVDECSTPRGSGSRGNSSQRLHRVNQNMLGASSLDSDRFVSSYDVSPLPEHLLNVPFSATRALSINSIYGTPPDIVVTEESPSDEEESLTGLDQASPESHTARSLYTAESVNTINLYGTPPQTLSTSDLLCLDQEHQKISSENESPQNEEIGIDGIHSKNSLLVLSQQDNKILQEFKDGDQPRIVMSASLDEKGEIKNLTVVDKLTPSLTASTITIESPVETWDYAGPPTISLRKHRRERYFSMCASDSALHIADHKRNAISVSENDVDVDHCKANSKPRPLSASFPESLNYLAFADCGYSQYNASSRDNADCQDSLCAGYDEVDKRKNDSICSLIFKSISDSIATTFRRREPGLRAMVIADVIANFFVSFIVVAETDNTFLYLNKKLEWSFQKYTMYYGIKSAVDGAALLLVLPLLRRFLGIKDAALGVLGGLSRSAFFIMLALIQTSSQVYSVPFVGIFGQYLFVVERAIMSSLVDEDEQGRVFTVLCSVDQLALLFGALTFDNLFSVFIKKGMPGVTLLIAGFLALVPTVIFGALYFSINAHQRTTEEEEEESEAGEEDSLLPDSCDNMSEEGPLFV